MKDKPWLQDGVAPQSPVGNIGIRRAFMPTDGSVPEGFVESHRIVNYKWIFDKINFDEKGYVKPR